jgi:DNA-binding IclR family transcriptional regulator
MALNPRQKAILAVLIKGNRWMTTAEIGRLARMSWNTAQTYLLTFRELEWVYRRGNYWKANIRREY